MRRSSAAGLSTLAECRYLLASNTECGQLANEKCCFASVRLPWQGIPATSVEPNATSYPSHIGATNRKNICPETCVAPPVARPSVCHSPFPLVGKRNGLAQQGPGRNRKISLPQL